MFGDCGVCLLKYPAPLTRVWQLLATSRFKSGYPERWQGDAKPQFKSRICPWIEIHVWWLLTVSGLPVWMKQQSRYSEELLENMEMWVTLAAWDEGANKNASRQPLFTVCCNMLSEQAYRLAVYSNISQELKRSISSWLEYHMNLWLHITVLCNSNLHKSSRSSFLRLFSPLPLLLTVQLPTSF